MLLVRFLKQLITTGKKVSPASVDQLDDRLRVLNVGGGSKSDPDSGPLRGVESFAARH